MFPNDPYCLLFNSFFFLDSGRPQTWLRQYLLNFIFNVTSVINFINDPFLSWVSVLWWTENFKIFSSSSFFANGQWHCRGWWWQWSLWLNGIGSVRRASEGDGGGVYQAFPDKFQSRWNLFFDMWALGLSYHVTKQIRFADCYPYELMWLRSTAVKGKRIWRGRNKGWSIVTCSYKWNILQNAYINFS